MIGSVKSDAPFKNDHSDLSLSEIYSSNPSVIDFEPKTIEFSYVLS